MTELSFGQRMDGGLVQPWFTHGALDAISKMFLSGKVIWMWGAGLGDTWLAKRCGHLYCVERNQDWIAKSAEIAHVNGVENISYIYRPCNEGSGSQDMYCDIPEDIYPDVFIVDDAYRYECILKAIEHKPCTLIVDNFMQAFVFMCPSAVEALQDYEGMLYEQSDHKDHDGINKWKTGIWQLK